MVWLRQINCTLTQLPEFYSERLATVDVFFGEGVGELYSCKYIPVTVLGVATLTADVAAGCLVEGAVAE